jgi:hypothetical protein
LTIDPGAIPRPLLQNVIVTSGVTSLAASGESGLTPSYTPVEPGESLVIVAVRARWQFVPVPR